MFNKDIKDPVKFEEFKTYLRSKYLDIINCYKYYASRANTELWQITLNLYTEFINNCPGLVEENYNANFIKIILVMLMYPIPFSKSDDLTPQRLFQSHNHHAFLSCQDSWHYSHH